MMIINNQSSVIEDRGGTVSHQTNYFCSMKIGFAVAKFSSFCSRQHHYIKVRFGRCDCDGVP